VSILPKAPTILTEHWSNGAIQGWEALLRRLEFQCKPIGGFTKVKPHELSVVQLSVAHTGMLGEGMLTHRSCHLVAWEDIRLMRGRYTYPVRSTGNIQWPTEAAKKFKVEVYSADKATVIYNCIGAALTTRTKPTRMPLSVLRFMDM
jgi:hypothetical protein